MVEVAWFELEALSDLVLSAHSGTAGNHETLPHVPGSALLGAVAGRLYERLGRDAWTVFHSGRVRFGHALPLDGAELAVPVPRSWHAPKRTTTVEGGRFVPGALTNRSHPKAQVAKEALRSLRDGHVTRTGRRLLPARPVHVKSARDAGSRRSADGALFAYEALPEGSRFVGHLTWDSDVPTPLVAQVLEVLAPDGRATEGLRVGGSRSAQFGRVRITRRRAGPELPAPRALGHWVQLLLLSDLALEDPAAGPTLHPTTAHFGLPAGHLDARRTFAGSRSYRPFNGKRAAPDLGRDVLVAGSVLTFELEAPIDEAGLAAVNERRHGLHVQEGLGQVLANPQGLLDEEQPRFATPASPATRLAAPLPATPLASWLEARRGAHTLAASARDRAKDLSKRLGRLHGLLRRDVPGGVPPAQWAKLVEVARGTRSADELGRALERALTEGVAGQLWSAPILDGDRPTSLRDVISRALEGSSPPEAAAILQRVRDERRGES